MLRLMAVAFALTLASSAQPLPPYHPISQTHWWFRSAKYAAPVCTT
jgi:hypothetical protein